MNSYTEAFAQMGFCAFYTALAVAGAWVIGAWVYDLVSYVKHFGWPTCFGGNRGKIK